MPDPASSTPAPPPSPVDQLPAATIAVLMGVSGSGKTFIGQILSKRTGLQFADADDFHPESNKQKLHAGQPLTDADRQPWLERLNQLLVDWHNAGQGGILACSALKDDYRTTLAQHLPTHAVRFVLLEVPRDMLQDRLAHRNHPFMSPALLDSQIATLEHPDRDDALIIRNDHDADQVVSEIVAGLQNEPMPG